MVTRKLYFLALLVTFVSSASVDCSEEDTCFGEPKNCVPDRNCNTLIHFDRYGNLHLLLQNFSNPHGYAAFAVDQVPEYITRNITEELVEYLICLPYHRQRLRAVAELGGLVLVTHHNLFGSIEYYGDNNFRCRFSFHDLPDGFRENQDFFVTRGTYEETFVIYDGVQLYNLVDLIDYRLDDEIVRGRRRAHARRQKEDEDDNDGKYEPQQPEYDKEVSEDEVQHEGRHLRHQNQKAKNHPVRYEEEEREVSEISDEQNLETLPQKISFRGLHHDQPVSGYYGGLHHDNPSAASEINVVHIASVVALMFLF